MFGEKNECRAVIASWETWLVSTGLMKTESEAGRRAEQPAAVALAVPWSLWRSGELPGLCLRGRS